MSIYGYYLPTTPYLTYWESKGNLIAYSDVISSVCGTNPSIANMFTFKNYENNMLWSKSENLIQIMKYGGYKTYWISNQEKIDMWGSAVSAFSDCANERFYTNEFASPRDSRAGRYDGKILDILGKQNFANKNFIVIKRKKYVYY